jgi:hypothetical protein
VDPLEIKMVLNRDQAKQAAEAHIADAKRMEDATDKATTAAQRQYADTATASIAADRKRDASGRFVAANQREQAQSIGVAFQNAGNVGSKSFVDFAAKVDLTRVGMSLLKSVVGEVGSAIDKAAQSYAKIANQFASDRDRFAELATVVGGKPDDAFAVGQSRFNQQAGFRPEEGLAYRLSFNNSGQQFKGKTLTDAEFGQYEEQAAALIAAKGFNPDQSGDLAGTLIGFKNRTGMGDKGSEDALGKLNSGLAILGRGKGRNSVLVNQFSMLASASLSEDELSGTFTDSDEVATAISLMAEKHDASAAEMVRAANRGFRDFDGKAKELLAKAGVNAKTKFADAVRKIAPIVEAEAKASNLKTADVLKKYFPDELTTEAINTAINRGIGGGVLADREAFARQNQGPGPALGTIKDFRESNRGIARQADANIALAEANRAAENSEVDLLRKQAEARLSSRGELDSTFSAITDAIVKYGSLGYQSDPRRQRIDYEAMNILSERDSKLFDPGRNGFDIPVSIESSNDFIRNKIAETRSRGFDPFAPGGRRQQGAAVGPDVGPVRMAADPQMSDQTRVLIEIRDALKRIADGRPASPGANTPMLTPLAQPGPRQAATR